MLAEKYRPTTFDEVVGQNRIVAQMKWYLDQPNASGHAFLLTGPSGSGKTTLAYCAGQYWGIDDFDIVKVESAECDVSRLRELYEHLPYYGVGGKGRKLYMLDEIHTLTGRAADRLLSLLEALPRHVLFIGTTTEESWASPVLLSRFVRFDLSKPRSKDIAAHLESIAAREGLPLPEDGAWAEKLVKYHGLNLRDLVNQLPARLMNGE
ncbi:MAG: Flp pilus assembly complex ATPase component TadA [Planctomycetia bacterium]|nr:Flp pilus assembly complex ATPase component TadA [Planctomycetia bacterium]